MTSKKRRQRLSSDGVKRIVRAIQATDPALEVTWKDVQKLAGEHAGNGYIWTRQALERHADIKAAYLAHEMSRKKLAKDAVRSGRRYTESQKIARLEQECADLRATLDRYDERFATYIANAISHGLSVEQLSTPLSAPTLGAGNSDK